MSNGAGGYGQRMGYGQGMGQGQRMGYGQGMPRSGVMDQPGFYPTQPGFSNTDSGGVMGQPGFVPTPNAPQDAGMEPYGGRRYPTPGGLTDYPGAMGQPGFVPTPRSPGIAPPDFLSDPGFNEGGDTQPSPFATGPNLGYPQPPSSDAFQQMLAGMNRGRYRG